MKMIKGLILGSAAGLLAMGGAQAADLPVKAKAVEYVKICSLYGAGFYYIPGTDTCIRIGGYARIDTSINSTIYNNPFIAGTGGLGTRSRDYTSSRSRIGFQEDTRTATEYGVLRTYASMQMQWTDSVDGIAGGNFETDFAFIQFAGFTMGKAVSMFDTQWVLAQPATSSGLNGGSDDKTGINQFAYTASFGNGVSATASIEDPRPYRRGGVYSVTAAGTIGVPGSTAFTNSEGGIHMPDFVGNLRLDQAWGSLHFAGAAHEVAMTYYNPANETSGHADGEIGYAFTGGFELKNIPTGVGDTLRGDVTYAHGAVRYVLGGTQNINGSGYAKFGSSDTAYQSVTFGQYADAFYTTNGSLELSTAWAGRLFYEHYWNPQWRTSLYGIYSHYENSGGGNALLMTKYNTAGTFGAGSTAALTGDTSFNIWQIGSRTSWQPVKDLTFSAEVLYTRLDSNLSGTVTPATNFWSAKPGTTYQVKDQDTVSGIVTALRSF